MDIDMDRRRPGAIVRAGAWGVGLLLWSAVPVAFGAAGGGGIWRPDLTLQGSYHTPAGLAGGGEMARAMVGAQAGLTQAAGPQRMWGVFAGAGLVDYRFSGPEGFASPAPWDRIETLQVGAIWRQPGGERWSWMLMPSVRAQAETGAALDDSLTAGAIATAAWRVHPRLTLGPGVGLFTEIEQDPRPFIFPMIDWAITDRLSVGTGRGAGASRGPGLGLTWQATSACTLGVGGRYDRLRFRLDGDGPAPDGVGQERMFTLAATASQRLAPWITLTGVGGISFAGDLRVENRDGATLERVDLDPAWMLGAQIGLRWP